MRVRLSSEEYRVAQGMRQADRGMGKRRARVFTERRLLGNCFFWEECDTV
jgi:hypothetical protein